MNSQRVNGGANAGVICQEFLKGDEYVVDHVSRDGVHKTVMIWIYDKRPTNGAAFVYYGMIPVDSSTVQAQILIKYTREVLDALGLANGPTHAEIMMTSSGPCLVEMNCRAHGWMGGWVPLAKAMTGGYAQPGVALDSYLNAEAFASIPDVTPSPFKATGQTVMLVSFFEGIVRSTPGYDRIRKLPSFVALQTDIVVGSKVERTVDLATAIGVLVLANAHEKELRMDLRVVRTMEKEGLFVFKNDVHSNGSNASTEDDCIFSESDSSRTREVSPACSN
jgi:biotin carboxylase